jgi:hypothetical protein
LFSNDQVARFINQNFEPTWEMVREVPIIHIDFGGGNVLTRTLHGNILTSVCTADGQTLDALPGIYNPPAYLDQLDQFRLLYQNFNKVAANGREKWVRDYHENAVAAIKAKQTPARFVETKPFMPVGKAVIEIPAQVLLARGQLPGQFGQQGPPVANPFPAAPPPPPPVTGDAEELAGWKALAEDTQLNETTRRRQIHELLAKEGLVAPSKVMKPIYRDVLHADLDDPYLGLGKSLFESYPFAKEDAKP